MGGGGVHKTGTVTAQNGHSQHLLTTPGLPLRVSRCLVPTLRRRNRSGVCEAGGAGRSLDTLVSNHYFEPHELARCLEKVRIAAPPWQKSANAGRNIINICHQQSVSVTSGDGRPRCSQGGTGHIKLLAPCREEILKNWVSHLYMADHQHPAPQSTQGGDGSTQHTS